MQPPAETPAWILISTGLGTVTGAVIALIGAAIALRGVRLTAKTTWRTAQIDRQHEALLGFYDATNNPRITNLDHAWGRLRLTGPRFLADKAKPMYDDASKLSTISSALAVWKTLVDRTQIEADEQERCCARHEREFHPDGSYCSEIIESQEVYEALREFTDLDSPELEAVQSVTKKIDCYANATADRTDGTTGNLVTGKDIKDVLTQHDHPCALRAEQKQLLAKLERTTADFIAAVNDWQDKGKTPEPA